MTHFFAPLGLPEGLGVTTNLAPPVPPCSASGADVGVTCDWSDCTRFRRSDTSGEPVGGDSGVASAPVCGSATGPVKLNKAKE